MASTRKSEKYRVSVRDPSGQEIYFEAEQVKWQTEGGVHTDSDGNKKWNGQGRMTLRAWIGCETYDDYEAQTRDDT